MIKPEYYKQAWIKKYLDLYFTFTEEELNQMYDEAFQIGYDLGNDDGYKEGLDVAELPEDVK